ncbi:MAG: mechanosensitive ion channel family protein [Spirochaetes bacterium]|nr:mechanosensitive ion channel family protein [Spirochaetota bacterium]
MQYFEEFSKTIENFLFPFSGIMIFKTPLSEYIIFAASFVIFFMLFFFSKKYILLKIKSAAKKKGTVPNESLMHTIRNINIFFHIVTSLFIATKISTLNPVFEKLTSSLFIILLVYQIVKFSQNIGMYFIKKFWFEGGSEDENTTAVLGLNLILKIIIWTIGFLLVLTNLGFEISALVASLGISSIAVAFALQSILSDIFSSFSIYLDRPFQVNDFIIVGEDLGTVKKIGIKSTRIQTLHGEELIISNHELTNSRIHNYKQMDKRRVVFHLGVTYGTSHEKLELIPKLVKYIITNTENTEFDRAHFQNFGDFSLNFEFVYYVTTGDYNIYMDVQQIINLEIVKAFESEGIEFAFPTTTVHISKN